MQMTGPRLRLDDVTAGRVDAVLLLLPAITRLEASVMMAASGVPVDVAARVLTLPGARRCIKGHKVSDRYLPQPGF